MGRSAELYKLAFSPEGRPPIRLVPTEINKQEIPLRKEGYVYLPVAAVPAHWLGAHSKNAVLIRISVDSDAGTMRVDALLTDQKFYTLKFSKLDIRYGNFLEAALVSNKINLYSVIDWEGKRKLFFQVSEGTYKGEPRLLNLEDAELIRPLPSPDGHGFFVLAFHRELKKLVIYRLDVERLNKSDDYEVTYNILRYQDIHLRDAQTGIVANTPGIRAFFKLFLIQTIQGRQQISFLDTIVHDQPRVASLHMPTQKWDSNIPLILYSPEMPRDAQQRELMLSQSRPEQPHIYGASPQQFERPRAQLAPEVPLLSELPPPPCEDIVK